MARIRTIKPEFWESEDTSRLSPLAALSFIGLVSLADDEGRGRADAVYLYSRLHHGRTVKPSVFNSALREIEQAGLVQFYEDDKKHRYYWVVNFSKHQVINKRSNSKLPPPPQLPEDYGSATVPLPHGMDQGSGNGMEGNGIDSSVASKAATLPAVPVELLGLPLYESDRRLINAWPKVFPAWKAACPGVDVVAETRKAHAWELSNPTRQKRNRASFLANWMNRAQDSASRLLNSNGTYSCSMCDGKGKIAYGAGTFGTCSKCSGSGKVVRA